MSDDDKWTYGDGRQPLGPAPVIPRPDTPEPNDEDRERAKETGRSPEYWASMRTVRNLAEWEASRRAEAERQARR